MPFDLRKAFANIVELTGDPLGPIKVQEAHDRVDSIGRMFAGCSSKEQVAAINTRLMSDFEDTELDELSKKPEFIVAICGMLVQSLVNFGTSQG